jgi:hypothetical protein
MLPVDHDMAVKKRWGKMPLPELVTRLKERTAGRLLRIDDQITTNRELQNACPSGTSAQDWKDFTSRVTVDPLFFEVTI